MGKLPRKIDCHITEAIYEIRFTAVEQQDVFVGMVLFSLKDYITKPEQLPIMQLPLAIRNEDPDLRYSATHKADFKSNANLKIGIGPRVIFFSNTTPYLGWEAWSSSFIPIVKIVLELDLIKEVERTGLRYINVYKHSILDKIKLNLSMDGSQILKPFSSIRIEFSDDNYIKVLSIINNGFINRDGAPVFRGSAIDIDCLRKINLNRIEFLANFVSVTEQSHKVEKDFFFSLLTDDFLQTLNPIYSKE
jgi:uncharacterized protein (TIGR04255 family)